MGQHKRRMVSARRRVDLKTQFKPKKSRLELLDTIAPKQITIYALHDPTSNDLRYIGQTKHVLRTRLRGHLRDQHTNARTLWIRELLERGLVPLIREVEVIKLRLGERPATIWDRANEREDYWIRQMRKSGNKLLNSRKAVPYGPVGRGSLARSSKGGYSGYKFRQRRVTKKVVSLSLRKAK
jgi:hypothetical protein